MAEIEKNTNFFWNLDDQPFNFPSKVRKIYEKIYIKNRLKITNWLDKLGKIYGNDLDWWMLPITLRDPYKSKLLDYVTVIETVKKIKSKNIEISSKSKALINFLRQEYPKKGSYSVYSNSFQFFKVINNLIKSFLFQMFLFTYVKLFERVKIEKKNIILVDKFVTSNSIHNESYFLFKKNNIYTVPTFIPTLNIIKFFKTIHNFKKKEKNYLFRESFVTVSDIIFAFCHYFRRRKYLDINYDFNNRKINKIIKEEISTFDDFTSISLGILNYKFFYRLKKRNVKISATLNWFENQLIDKGWNLGFKTFFRKNYLNCFGYQDFSKHYNYINHSPSKIENFSGVTPEKIIIISKSFVNSTKEFYKKQKFLIGETWRFRKYLNKKIISVKKRGEILFIMCGVKEIDEILLNIAIQLCDKIKPLNVLVKFHPILDSKYLKTKKIFPKNLIVCEENLSRILDKTFLSVTSGPSSALLESSSSGITNIIPNIECGTKKNMKILSLKKNQYFITENTFKTISKIIDLLKREKRPQFTSNKLIRRAKTLESILSN